MELGLVGLGRMGMNMTRRLLEGGHRVVVFNRSPGPVEEARRYGAVGTASLAELAERLTPPRVVWLMLPTGAPTTQMLDALLPLLQPDDLVVDGANAHYRDSQRRARELAARGLRFVDAGVSGGVWGRELGYCLMVGGAPEDVQRLEPVLRTLAPRDGYAHVGPPGAGHFVKMVHNAIEYGMLQAIGEGFELLHASEFPLDLRQIAHLWNQGSVVRSWLMELAERAFAADPGLDGIRGYVEDTGYGRWTVQDAVERAVPVPAIALALFARFRSRQEDSFSARVVAALRRQFGGHAVHQA
ncbi:MAG: decarboxylating 6-phosphogluconate dehydrogenase [Armatimonadota bacterium]|nr:decarboxylating 6-phosphogluconate dehydrogenase [Armatimonadota bacterium]MDR7459960.1 decarboxylating 6-phosphogluconate dehydrogenase [Armatimonadota bacterium]MDR7479594.1 decarboxylating 6-phosphogluconate dehydrogenase [Armatimonadota bacterium]MDR7488585.1 decarboxylating 6-phosphogluconate dehydrogenase [Armatimonadota bacterium]MDR7490567.1 decarboxylating 6-phosphogluconate dehydrogenase [Armatimonadota bacterium]